jgi:hypothetical protein
MDDFGKIWKSLPENEKKTRLIKIYCALKKRSDSQLLDKFFSKKRTEYLFFLALVKECISDIDFFFSLGKNKWKDKSFYPARSIVEKAAKLGYWFKQDKNEQIRLARIEILIWIKKGFIINTNPNDFNSSKLYRKNYNKLKAPSDPSIDEKLGILKNKSFPSIEICLKKGDFDKPDYLYNFYRAASGSIHANFGEILMKTTSFQTNAFIVIAIYLWLIKCIDFHLYGKVQDETKSIIETTDSIAKKQKNKKI